MRPVSLFLMLFVLTGITVAKAAAPFSTFTVVVDYNLTQSPMTSVNEDIRELDAYYHSGDWSRDLQSGQNNDQGDQFNYPLVINTERFQNLPSFAIRLETNLDLLWHFGLEYNQGGVSSNGFYAYAPGGQNDGYVKRRETLNYRSGLLYGKFRIRDRVMPLFAYVGAGIGFASLDVDGLYELGNKFNADYMQRWLLYTNEHSGSALTGRGFLGMEYQLPFSSNLFVECGYNYQNFGELDGSTDLAINDPYRPSNYDQNPDNDTTEYFDMEGARPATYDYVYDFIYWYVDENDNNHWDPGEETDTFSGIVSHEGTYNGDTIEFDLSGFYFNVGIGFSF
jgi:opacity protein-like surface antigen